MASVAVLGAGISGLTATYFLARQAKQTGELIKKIHLFERSSRCGGWISSTRYEDGAVYEHGPHTIRSGSNASRTLLTMMEEIGMTSEILPVRMQDPGNSRRLLYVNDKLYPLPLHPKEIVYKMPPFTERLISPIWRERRVPKGSGKDESVDSFFRRRFGDEIADYLVGALCCGIYAGDSKLLGLKSCFPKVLDMEQRLGSVSKGFLEFFAPGFSAAEVDPDDNMSRTFTLQSTQRSLATSANLAAFTLRDGLESLPERLTDIVLENPMIQVCMNTSIERITLQADSSHETTVQLDTDTGQQLQFDHVFCALPDHALGHILTGNGEGVDKLCTLVGSLPFVDVAVVNLEYAGDVPKARGFGYLIPPKEQSPLLGVIFDSCIAPGLDPKSVVTTRLTAMMGGSWYNERLGPNITEAELLQLAVENVAKQLHVTAQPVREKVRILRQCIPTYVVGHADRVRQMHSVVKENDLPITFTGASYDGVAVAEIVHNTIKSCKRFVRKLESAQMNDNAKYASM